MDTANTRIIRVADGNLVGEADQFAAWVAKSRPGFKIEIIRNTTGNDCSGEEWQISALMWLDYCRS